MLPWQWILMAAVAAALVILGAVLCWALWRGIKTIEQP